MRTNAELTGHGARSLGYQDELQNLNWHLNLLHETAQQAFWLQRETDPNYQDPRTDYLLGRKDAISAIISAINKEAK